MAEIAGIDGVFRALDRDLPELRSFLAEVAGLFGLPFQAADYCYFPLSAEEKVLLDFLGGCPGLPHSHWGNDEAVRRQNVGDFISNEIFHDYCAGLSSGGSVLDAEVYDHLTSCLQSHELPAWVHALSARLADHPGLQQPFGVYICLQESSLDTLKRMRALLVHEWSHLLFFSQGLQFAKADPADPDAWLMDEGLAKWIECRFVTGDWNSGELLKKNLEHLQQQGKPPSVTGYFEKGLWFNDRFRDLPRQEWGQALRDLLDELRE